MLSTTVFDPVAVSIGTAITIGGVNNPFREDYTLLFPYSVQTDDYFAGVLQFLYDIQISVTIDPQANIGLAAENPFRRDYGTIAIGSFEGGIIETRPLQFESQSVQYLGYSHRLPRQEASRPKTLRLSSRPRLRISNPAAITVNLNGNFPVNFSSFTGALLNPASGGPVNGTITPSATLTPPAFAAIGGQLRLEIGDGDLRFTTGDNDAFYYPNSNTNNLGDGYRPSVAKLFLKPGVSGTLKLTVFKLQESGGGSTLAPPPYVPVGPFLLP